jgi:hypothetical protein
MKSFRFYSRSSMALPLATFRCSYKTRPNPAAAINKPAKHHNDVPIERSDANPTCNNVPRATPVGLSSAVEIKHDARRTGETGQLR